MANTNININIQATGQSAIQEIKRVETAVANLGKNATANFTLTGIDDIKKQISSLTSKATGNNKINIATGLSESAITKMKEFGDVAVSSTKKATNGMTDLKKGVANSSLELDNLGSRFRYLSLVTGIISAGVVALTKSWVDSAAKMEQSYIKLSAYAKIYNSDLTKMDKLASEMTNFGVSKDEAATVVANITAMGLGAEKTEKLIRGMMDTAITSKENLNDTFGQALVKSSQGFRAFLERQIDAVGVNTDLNKVLISQAHAMGKTKDQLTQNEKYIIEYNYYIKEFNKNSGAASGASQTFSGTLSRMSARIQEAKIALGNAMVPLMGTLAEGAIKAANAIREMANAHPGLTSSVITGTVAITGFVTVFATIGALVPMVVSGLNITKNALMAMVSTSSLVAIKFTLLAMAIGGAIYLILNATGQWKKWSDAIKNVANTMANAINPINEVGKAATDVGESVKKSFDSLKDSIIMFVRDTRQDMAQWVADLDKKIADHKTEIEDLTKSYEKATAKIKRSFESAMADNTLSHTRKTEDLQQQIDEEVSKGIWADQTKIKELKKELARENEDYALASQEKIDTKDEELKSETDAYTEKLAKLKKELDAEKKLESDHASEIANIRSWNVKLLDDYEKKQQDINDRIVGFNKDIKDLMKTMGEDANKATEALGGIATEAGNVEEKLNNISWGTSLGKFIGNLADGAYSLFSAIYEKIKKINWSNVLGNLADWTYKTWEDVKKNFKDALTEIGQGDYFSGIMGSLALLALALAGIETFLKYKIPTAATVGFASSALTANGFVASLTLKWGALATLMTAPIYPVIAITAAIAAIGLIGAEWIKLKNDIDAAKESEDKASAMRLQNLKSWRKEIDNGTMSLQTYNQKLTNIGLNNWSDRLFNNVQSFFSNASNISSMYSSNNSLGYSSAYRAEGGSVYKSNSYVVGERGPELFIPDSNGTIVPNNELGGTTNNFSISINNPSVRSNADIQSIAQAVKDVISREMALKRFS